MKASIRHKLETISERIYERQFGAAVRLETTRAMSDQTRRILIGNLELDPQDEICLEAPLDFTGLFQLHGIERHDLAKGLADRAVSAAGVHGDRTAPARSHNDIWLVLVILGLGDLDGGVEVVGR